MRDREPNESERYEHLLTWRSGGWVLALTGVVLVSLIAWALWTPLFRAINRPPGDGVDPATYGFDITALDLPLDLVATPLLPRDMVPVMREPTILTITDVEARAEGRKKYLVSSDRVVGVEIGGAARAYPLTVLTVHEVVEDTLAGVPIAVTYSWLGDAARVFDRRLDDEVITLGTSGLVYN
jgi:hypothetical protein